MSTEFNPGVRTPSPGVENTSSSPVQVHTVTMSNVSKAALSSLSLTPQASHDREIPIKAEIGAERVEQNNAVKAELREKEKKGKYDTQVIMNIGEGNTAAALTKKANGHKLVCSTINLRMS